MPSAPPVCRDLRIDRRIDQRLEVMLCRPAIDFRPVRIDRRPSPPPPPSSSDAANSVLRGPGLALPDFFSPRTSSFEPLISPATRRVITEPLRSPVYPGG